LVTVGVTVAFDAAGFLFVGLSSSESLLLDAAAFLTGCGVGFAVGVDFTGDTDGFFFLSSSDESESDDESFFLALARAVDGGTTGFLTGEVVAAFFIADFLSSESLLDELLDTVAFDFGTADFEAVTGLVVIDGFFLSSSDEDDVSCLFLLAAFVGVATVDFLTTGVTGVAGVLADTGATLAGCFFLSSSDESEDEDSFVFLFATAGDGGTTPFFALVTATGALTGDFVRFLSSSESLLLLDAAGFFVEVAVTFGLLASTADDDLSFSSDESESDEDLAFF
jgi:hypothetical protein